MSARVERRHGRPYWVWQFMRTIGFYLIGAFNTVWLPPEDAGSWKNVLGWVVLGIAVLDTIRLVRGGWRARRRNRAAAS